MTETAGPIQAMAVFTLYSRNQTANALLSFQVAPFGLLVSVSLSGPWLASRRCCGLQIHS